MTTTAVFCDPPHEEVLGALSTAPISSSERADLYAAMCADTFRAVEESGTDLLVNYRGENADELRALVADALDSPDEARFEPQVGETFSGRVGNTLTHLLETEDESSVMALTPTAPFLTRSDIDGMAMKLRRNDVVLGPTSGGRVYAACFGTTIDFATAYALPAITTLTDRALDAGLDVDYAPLSPMLETRNDLIGALALIEARRRAGRQIPAYTAECFSELGLALTGEENEAGGVDEMELSRPDTDNP